MLIKTRFSPSPTGMLHLGNVRAALFSALFAKKMQGIFLLRIEDTDVSRSEEKYIDMLQDDLHWLGLDWQEGPGTDGPNGPYWQSHRLKIYEKYYQQLENMGRAYPCFCTEQELALNRKIQLSRGHAPRYPGTCRALSKEEIGKRLAKGLKPSLRFRVPQETQIEFLDLVKGQQKFNSDDIGDFIIRRADGTSSFLFCNAIDDSLMEITHVLRGDDHLANTPRQLMILQSLQMRTAQYGHLSLITGDDGTPLSKRHGSYSLHDLHQQGYLPLAILNYLGRLSHVYEEHHLMSFIELADAFQVEKLSRASARFDKHQLLHWQKEAVMSLDLDAAWQWIGQLSIPEHAKDLFIDVMRKNILFPEEAKRWASILFSDPLSLSEENTTIIQQAGKTFFSELLHAVQQHGIDLKTILQELKNKLGISGKSLFLPIRIALTGEEHGPELAHIASLLGKEKMLSRVHSAIALSEPVKG